MPKQRTFYEAYDITEKEVILIRPNLSKKQLAFVQYFLDALGAKDPYTQKHSYHVTKISEAIFQLLPADVGRKLHKEKLLTAALLHDIGKLNVPLDILNKPGRLTEEEWLVMYAHPRDGKAFLHGTMFEDIGDWILYHHERIDGHGYYGVTEKDIPLESRIIAIADTFSALRTHRVYRPAISLEKAIDLLKKMAGTQLDSDMVTRFLSLDKTALTKLDCNCPVCITQENPIADITSGIFSPQPRL